MNQASKNYIPPMRMACVDGITVNMSLVQSMKCTSDDHGSSVIFVSYINGNTEHMYCNNPKKVIRALYEQVK